MEQPSVQILGVTVAEPVTVLTDLLVTAVCVYAFVRLRSRTARDALPTEQDAKAAPAGYGTSDTRKLRWLLRYHFLTMGIATAIGGLIGHGFLYAFSFAWKLPGWIISMLSIMLIERASIEHVQPLVRRWVAQTFRIVNLVELLTFMAITFITLNFFFVQVHSAYGLMAVVFSLQLFAYLKTRTEGSRWFLIAVGWSALSALFYMNQISLHVWFNYYDISHTLMAVAAGFMYVGAQKILAEHGERGGLRPDQPRSTQAGAHATPASEATREEGPAGRARDRERRTTRRA